MDDEEFSRLLRLTHNAAKRHSRLQAQVGDAFEKRYRCHYSDCDADSIIDALDLGHGKAVTRKECDEEMARSGWPYVHIEGEKDA